MTNVGPTTVKSGYPGLKLGWGLVCWPVAPRGRTGQPRVDKFGGTGVSHPSP